MANAERQTGADLNSRLISARHHHIFIILTNNGEAAHENA
jgi:hypothetical protein